MMDIDYLKTWEGRQEVAHELIGPEPVKALSAMLDRDDPPPKTGDPLPLPWHWLYFLPRVKTAELGVDGHPKRGGFLPPVPLPRRMWAGSRIQCHSPMCVGDEVQRVSTIKAVNAKDGKSGQLVFVTVVHEISAGGQLALSEEQDIVYREEPTAGAPAPKALPASAQAQWSRDISPGPVMLFRYSALTFNSHRIHYDRPYATQEEGYPGLVVHGPLTATLLLDLLYRQHRGARVKQFEFSAVRPISDLATFQVQGREDDAQVQLWALDGTGALAMKARAVIE